MSGGGGSGVLGRTNLLALSSDHTTPEARIAGFKI